MEEPSTPKSKSKLLLVGWDAADWKIIHRLMDVGLMPTVKSLVEGGVMANLATLSPVLSPMLWTSIATGKRPFDHGIYGFSEPTPDGKSIQPVTNLSRKTKAIWNILQQNGLRSNVIGWWPSHPAEPIDGVMVSNRYQRGPASLKTPWPMLPDTVHPARLSDAMAELRMHPEELEDEHIRPFIPFAEEIDQKKDPRLFMCAQIIADCTTIQNCATELMETEPWDFMAVYFDAIDHFCHAFMKYHPPQQDSVSDADFRLYQNVVSAGYVYHDLMLARLLELAGEDTTVVLMSDHGFHPDNLRPRAIPAEPAGPAIEHRDLGIFVMNGPGIRKDEFIHGASLLDIAPTILTHFGLPIGEDMHGRVLTDVFEKPPTLETIPSWDEVEGESGQHPPERRLEAGESEEALRQLVALGYIEEPPSDRKMAVEQTKRELDYNLARAFMDAGRHGDAMTIFTRLYLKYPLEFRFGIQLSLCLQALEMTDEMLKILTDLNSRWRKAAEKAKSRLGEIAAIGKQRQKDREISANGDDAESQVFNEAERKVIQSLRAIARGNERTLDFLFAAGALASGDAEGALKSLETASESETRVPGFHLQIGEAYLKLNRLDEAEASFNKALELDPHHPSAFVGICRCMLRRNRQEEALEAASRAVAIKYHFPPAHYYRGVALVGNGRHDEAVRSFETALKQNPNFPEAHEKLAKIFDGSVSMKHRAHRHRELAQELLKENRSNRAERPKLELPVLDELPFEADLPSFPEPAPPSNLLLPLAAGIPKEKVAEVESGTAFATIVSGLPRSGTSMMMQMLKAGGLEPLTDDEREADPSNPRGYFELDKVKSLHEDNRWLPLETPNRAIKIVAPLVPWLPQALACRVIFMEREPHEIVSSQRQMLERLGAEGASLSDERLVDILEQQAQVALKLLSTHGIPVLRLSYSGVVADPHAAAEKIARFLDLNLDISEMMLVTDPALHRVKVPGPVT